MDHLSPGEYDRLNAAVESDLPRISVGDVALEIVNEHLAAAGDAAYWESKFYRMREMYRTRFTEGLPTNQWHERYCGLANAVEAIKHTGGRVEVHGVRIEACDDYGQTISEQSAARDAALQNSSADARVQAEALRRAVLDHRLEAGDPALRVLLDRANEIERGQR